MLGVGTGELLMILVIAVLVVGPERMVEFAGQAGRWLAKFRQMTDSVTKEFQEAISLEVAQEGQPEAASTVSPAETDAVSEGAVAPVAAEAQIPALPTADAAQSPVVVPAASERPSPWAVALTPIDGEAEQATGWLARAAGEAPNAATVDVQPVLVPLAELVPDDIDVEPTLLEPTVLIVDEPAPAEDGGGTERNP